MSASDVPHASSSGPQDQPAAAVGASENGSGGARAPEHPHSASPARPTLNLRVLVLLEVLVLLAGGTAAWVLYLSPTHPASPLFDRHGLPVTVPLPDDVSFLARDTRLTVMLLNDAYYQVPVTFNEPTWVWSVRSTDDATRLARFYLNTLPLLGWRLVNQQRSAEGATLIGGCQPSQLLVIDLSASRPPSGALAGPVAAGGGLVFALALADPSSQVQEPTGSAALGGMFCRVVAIGLPLQPERLAAPCCPVRVLFSQGGSPCVHLSTSRPHRRPALFPQDSLALLRRHSWQAAGSPWGRRCGPGSSPWC